MFVILSLCIDNVAASTKATEESEKERSDKQKRGVEERSETGNDCLENYYGEVSYTERG